MVFDLQGDFRRRRNGAFFDTCFFPDLIMTQQHIEWESCVSLL